MSFRSGDSKIAWRRPLPDAIREILVLLIEAWSEEDDAMSLEFELSEAIYSAEFDASNSGITRDMIMQYIAAGILFPEEVRQAEQILRHMSTRK